MSSRLSSALLLGSAGFSAFVLAGCWLDHGPLDALSPRDASVVPLDVMTHPADIGPPPELGWDGGPFDTFDAGMCTPRERAVTVRIEPLTSDTDRCAVLHVDGIRVNALEAVPEEDGIRLHADFCPDADADCRCDIVIGNVGVDVAPSEVLVASLTLDVRQGAGPGTFVALQEAPRCRCDGCPCSLALVLYAADIDPDFAPSLPPELNVTRGSPVCPDLGCVSGSWRLAIEAGDTRIDVPEGTDWNEGSVHVRAIRDEDVFAPCAACAGCNTPHASWVAWAG
jgi:hypothetical protein